MAAERYEYPGYGRRNGIPGDPYAPEIIAAADTLWAAGIHIPPGMTITPAWTTAASPDDSPDGGTENLAWALQYVEANGFGDLVDADSIIEDAARKQLTAETATAPGVHMRIVQRGQLIADLPDWRHPVPAPGDYLFHPPVTPGRLENIAGCVQTRTWHTHDRPDGPGAHGFTPTAHPYVELAI